jgi:formate hydrogenlyase subunit 3/multisubunit Na+/H+ antiporter MnhD subunit
MKFLVAIAFVAILLSLSSALMYMMRGSAPPVDGQVPKKGNMATALAFRVGFSIVLFLCVLLAWKMGWIQPTGIPPGA